MLFYAHGLSDPLLILLLGLALDLLLGEMRWLWRLVPHPVEVAGTGISWLDLHLNRDWRSDRTRLVRGILVAALFTVGAAAVGAALADLLRHFRGGWAIEVLIVAILLAQRSLFAHVARVATALRQGGLAAGREAVAHIVGRDPDSLDEHGVARAAIESLAESFSDGVVAPAFW